MRRGAKPPCDIFGFANRPNYVWVGGEVPLAELGPALAVRLGGVRVIDRTGNMDNFNFVLEWVTDKDTPGFGLEPRGPYANANVPPAQNVFVAVRDQRGLQLEPARTPRQFVVIDRIQRPSANQVEPCQLPTPTTFANPTPNPDAVVREMSLGVGHA